MLTETTTWLSFSLTPCQDFISAARTVRDLKVGSELLCWLVRQAMDAGRSAGGRLLFPGLDGTRSIRHIPNQFVMVFDPGEGAHAAAQGCEQAVRTAWREVSDRVKAVLDSAWRGPHGTWSEDWERQIESFWDTRTMVISPSAGGDDAYEHLYGRPCPDPWKRQWGLLAGAARAAKQVRHFPGDQGKGRAKCSMNGELEQMGPGGSVGQQAAFWTQTAADFEQYGIRLGKRDRLCAVSLVKRFAPLVPGELAHLRERVPDTAQIAISAWCREVVSEGRALPDLLHDWEREAGTLADLCGEYADTPGRYLLDENLTPEGIVRDCAPSLQEKAPKIKHAAKEMLGARRALLGAARERELGRPPRYFVVLTLDGDEIGKRLGGAYCEDGQLGPSYYEQLSSELQGYAEKARHIIEPEEVGERYRGYLIYAGGDDLLALVPLNGAVELARSLAREYPPLVPSGGSAPPATASVGLAICHYMHDLRDALRQARAALEEAKESGRDALGWHLLKRSGGAVCGVMSWDLAAEVAQLSELYSGGASDRWSYRLAEAQPGVGGDAEEEQVATLIRCFAGRAEGKHKEQVLDLALRIWRDLCQFQRYRADKVGRRYLPAECLERHVDLMGLASFVSGRQQ